MNRLNPYNALAIGLISVVCLSGLAKASQRLELNADSISYHDKSKVSEYHNHVKVIYGHSTFGGKHMLVNHGGSKAPSKLTLDGSPVTFLIQHNKNTISGHANSITLYPHKSMAVLHGDAVIFNGMETVHSQEITYHLSITQQKNLTKSHEQTNKIDVIPITAKRQQGLSSQST